MVTGDECRRFTLGFPADMNERQVVMWLGSVAGTLQLGPRRLFGVASLVLEVRANEHGIRHQLVAPRGQADFLAGQLRTLAPGSTVTPAGEEDPPDLWTTAVELGSTNPQRRLRAQDGAVMSARLLAVMQGLRGNEALVLQWVISPAVPSYQAAVAGTEVKRGFFGALALDKDALTKAQEPNFLAVLRVAVKAADDDRAAAVLGRVRHAFMSAGSGSTRFRRRTASSRRVAARIARGAAPILFPQRLAASELVGLLAWPIGSPHVAGLPRPRTRQLAATAAIPRRGRVIARSNFPGAERLLALDPIQSAQHLHVVGPTGSGKTALLTNLIAQDMNAGRGVVLIESKGDLFKEALARVPERRVQDVVLLDVSDTEYPVGWNILQGSPYVVAADIQRLFDHLYPGDVRGVRVRAGFYHLILTLMMSTGAGEPMSFADIGPLALPQARQEEFSRRLIGGVSHIEELADWWHGIDGRMRAAHFQPILDRIWQLNNRPSLRNIIGQSRSTLDLSAILRERKILLVNLGRAQEGKDTAGLLGSLLLNAIWSAVQGGVADATNPTMLYLDEFQDFTGLPVAASDWFAQARSLGLAVTVAHQYLGQLSRELRDATQNNARSTVVFQTSADEARDFARQFGRSVAEDDFTNLARFEVLMRLATEGGVSSPVSGVTFPPMEPTGFADEVRQFSRKHYGRPRAEVEAEISQRRSGRKDAPTQAPPATAPKKRRFGGPRAGD
ncbi:type IV secretory system conjugative DNA transfer family protein [Streptomyces scabiei]|uniref:type IV secretory system conjugative DNA transfer family protein n=1 Tax=Streptomyces scabiei TaxID=1930 RepID=UPI0036C80BB8